MSSKIDKMKTLLDRFEPLSKRTRCRKVVLDFQERELDKNIQITLDKRLVFLKECIGIIQNTQYYKLSRHLDIFKTLQIRPSENDFSDIIAQILDPRQSPIGRAIICSLLKKHKKNLSYRLLQNAINSQIHVKREVTGSSSRIDLRIWTKDNPKGDFVIDFEFKTGDGLETIHYETGEFQTDREWSDLLKFALVNNITEKNISAFFITPSGQTASCRNFISLRRSQLHEIIIEELTYYSKLLSRKSSNPFFRSSIEAFRWFFVSPYIQI